MVLRFFDPVMDMTGEWRELISATEYGTAYRAWGNDRGICHPTEEHVMSTPDYMD
jgi:hypothetical protein